MTHERLNLQCSAPHRPPRVPMPTPRTPTARCGPLAGPSSRVPSETAVSASGGPSQALPSHHKRTAAPRWAQQRAHRSPHAPNYGIPRAGRTVPVTVRTPPARQHLDLDVRARCSCHKDLRSTTRYTGTRQGHAESVRTRGSMAVGLRDAGWTYRLGWGERGWCGRAVGSAHLACPNLATRRCARPRRCNPCVTPGADAHGAARPF